MKSPAMTPLAEFLSQPNIETSPAWELINGRAIQKPMPTLFHSRLQRNLVNYINRHTDQFEAVQELRCLVPPYSPVLNISIVALARLPSEDEPLDGAPDWLIEIRSPDQSTLDLQNKILHCLSNGTQLAWLIEPARQQIWVWQGDDLPLVCSGADTMPVLGTLPEPDFSRHVERSTLDLTPQPPSLQGKGENSKPLKSRREVWREVFQIP